MANLNWCRTCGKEYPVCPHCEQDARLNPWRMICDTEPHFLVWTAVNQYRQGIISKETAKADLTTLLMRKYYLKDYLDEAKKNLGDFDVNQASQVMSALLDNKQEISAVLAKDKKE